MKKNKALLDKTEHALHQHSMFTILVGRFVGPTRPLVPMVAGMLDLPVANSWCRTLSAASSGRRSTSCRGSWPARPSIFLTVCKAVSLSGCCWHGAAAVAGMAVLAPVAQRESERRSPDALSSALSSFVAGPADAGCAVVALVALIRHPLMPVYGEILLKVVSR
jgi:hypothetical protein